MKTANRKMLAKQIYSAEAQDPVLPVNMNKQIKCGDEHD